MADLVVELADTLTGIKDKHKDSDCACSRLAVWLPSIELHLEEAVRVGPKSAKHRGRSYLLGRIGADLLSGSHSLDAQQSVLQVFEQ